MKNNILIILFLSSILSFSQSKRKTFRELTKDTNSTYKSYSEASNNSVHYNTGNVESKYDKKINLDADIDENKVNESLNKFREEKRKDEIYFYLKNILLISSLIVFCYLGYLLFSKKYKIVKKKDNNY